MRHLLLIFLCCTAANVAFAQQPDSTLLQRDTIIPDSVLQQIRRDAKANKIQSSTTPYTPVVVLPDSAAVEGKVPKKESFFYRYFVKKYPNPRAAALLSFILPGAGQAYNKKWWKIPIVYGAIGGMTWLALDNDAEYKRLKKNYKLLVDGDETTNPTEQPYVRMTSTQMKGYRDQFRGYTEKSYLFLGIVYLLAVTDAFVDAHLSQFDVSDDLTLRVIPDIQSGSYGFGASFGLGVQLGFGNASRSTPTVKHFFATP